MSFKNWCKKYCFGVMLTVLFFGAGLGVCYGDVYNFTLEAGSYEIVNAGEGYEEIKMAGFGQLSEPGKPKLPSKVFQIALPPGVKVDSVSFARTGEVELEGTYDIAPSPMVSAMSASEEELAVVRSEYEATMASAYSSDEAYPASAGEFVGQGMYRKYNLVHVRYSPFSYKAASQQLTLFGRLEVTVHFSPSSLAAAESEALMNDYVPRAEERAKEMLVNYNEAQGWYPMELGDDPISTTGGFVIVTTDALEDSVWPLKNWEMCKGRDVHVETVEDISSSYSGVDIAEKIRNFLRSHLSSWDIDKVCLIGDIDDVPMRYTYPNGPDGPDNDSTPWEEEDRVPTDYYYAELSWSDASSWNSNGDSMYGERGSDNVQFPSEVDVGRIPWSDPATVEDICMKMVEFEWSEDMSGYKLNYLLTGAYFWPDTDNAVLKTYILNNACNPGDPPLRIYEQGPCWNSSYYSEYTMTRTITRTVWGGGTFGFVNLAGHGSKYSVFFQERHATCSPEVYFTASDRSYLDEDYPSVVFSLACSTAWPEYQNMCKSLLERGSIGVIGATRVGFGVHGWDEPSDGGSQSLDWYFCDRAIDLGGGRSSVGWSHQRGLDKMYNDHGWDSSWYQMFEWNLYGNPDLWIRERPTALPNLTDVTPSGWDYPIVPRSATGATSGWCPLTSTLPGNSSSTYWNFAWTNNGSYQAPGNVTHLFLDGTYIRWASLGYQPVDYQGRFNNEGPATVKGGRHTLYYELDWDEKVWETNETYSDNCWSHQFIWSPHALSNNNPTSRGAPPKDNEWGCSTSQPGGYWYNNDGFSFEVQSSHPDDWWSAVGVVPGSSSSDYDIRLWDIGDYTGPDSEGGFGGGYLEQSSWGTGASDFVIVNDNQATAGTYYAGVLNKNESTSSYYIEEDTSEKIYEGINGPYSKNSTNVLDIYECSLNAGTYGFRLEQISGTCDLGISLYDDETVHCSKSEYMSGAYSNSGGDGEDEYFTVTIPDAGFHALVVWKVDSSDYSKTSTYKIRVGECGTPGAASYPSPADGSTEVGINTDLIWTASTDTDHYEVWLKEGSGSFVSLGETDNPNWDLDPLAYDTTYTWVIRSWNICNHYTDSDWWTFTTKLEPSIRVTEPDSGDTWYTGHSGFIQWTSEGITGNVKIELSRNGGASWGTIVSSTSDDGSYSWAVSGPASATCKIRVTSLEYPSASDVSNGYFEIAEPYITVLHPNGGEIWYAPDNEYIQWASGGGDKYVAIDISRNNGKSWTNIVPSTLNDGSHLWAVSGPTSRDCLIRVRDTQSSDTSDSTFAIYEREITVTRPDGGELWRMGDSQVIHWNSSNITGNVRIELSRNNGYNWVTLASSTANDGTWWWTVNEPASANCLIKVSSISYPAIYDISDAEFTCTYTADLNVDLMVNELDLKELCDEWLLTGNPATCTLDADLYGDDCKVDFKDYAVLANEWLYGTDIIIGD